MTHPCKILEECRGKAVLVTSEVKVSCKSNLVCHQITHDGEKPFKCDHWDKTFVLKSKFTFHQKTHIWEKPFKCEECDKSFVQKVDFICHQRKHNDEKLCKCNQ